MERPLRFTRDRGTVGNEITLLVRLAFAYLDLGNTAKAHTLLEQAQPSHSAYDSAKRSTTVNASSTASKKARLNERTVEAHRSHHRLGRAADTPVWSAAVGADSEHHAAPNGVVALF